MSEYICVKVTLLVDNQSAIMLIKNPIYQKPTKHIESSKKDYEWVGILSNNIDGAHFIERIEIFCICCICTKRTSPLELLKAKNNVQII